MEKEHPDSRFWLPAEIRESEEFLCEELQELRNHVKETRKEDIAEQLYVFENRVLYSENGWTLYDQLCSIIQSGAYRKTDLYGLKNNPIGWETIRTFPCENENGACCLHEIDKREVKRTFLEGWCETGLWDRGLHKRQNMFPPPEQPDAVGISPDEKDFFIRWETVSLSLDMMCNYAKMHMNLNPGQRKDRPRFVRQNMSVSKGANWYVYVTADLQKYYYGKDAEMHDSGFRTVAPLEYPMGIILCQKNTETRHAVIANYDSWQNFLYAFCQHRDQTPKAKGNVMNIENTLYGQMERLKKRQAVISSSVSDEIAEILRKMATECGRSGLEHRERQMIETAAGSSARIRVLKRMAETEYVRRRIGKYYSEQREKSHAGSVFSRMKDNIIRLVQWISPIWEPQWAGVAVTAADIPEQHHEFVMREGNIDISCSWQGAYGNSPAYIQISWTASLMTDCELWLRFVNPLTHDLFSEILLGAEPEGGKIITGDRLGFDPSKDRWATSIMMKPTVSCP
ncbi:MAG: hypothetical protein R2941_14470 [Desulfobacterales bacterium]